MSANSKIEWTDHTFNPWIGCTKVSPGCANCYAETEDKRRGWTPDGWGKGKPRKRTSEAYWRQAIKWNARPWICNECGAAYSDAEFHSEDPGTPMCSCMAKCHRPRVFPSLCDWLDDEVPIQWLADFLDLIRRTPNLDWLLLTKRPENFSARLHGVLNFLHLPALPHSACPFVSRWFAVEAPANVWLGVSIEDQDRAEKRVLQLLQTPASLRFLSCEPLLGPINLREISATPSLTYSALEPSTFLGSTIANSKSQIGNLIDWVIVGGESGPKARPCDIQNVRAIVQDCKTTGVPVFVKQLGAKPVLGESVDKLVNVGLVPPWAPLWDHKGGDPAEWPEDLRVREMPALEVRGGKG